MVTAAWQYSKWADRRIIIQASDLAVIAADGDSFKIGNNKLRLDGIDAPEFDQTCDDPSGAKWACGRAARGALEQHLAQLGLSCVAEAYDQYRRSIATCSNAASPDIAADLVRAGMAVSDEYYGMRSYGTEEDEARGAKRGIWRGPFILPTDWRAAKQATKS